MREQNDKNLHFIIPLPKDDPNYKKEFICFFLFQSSFNKLYLQIDRIKKDKDKNDLKSLFADIHFFLVALFGLKKLFTKLRNIYSNDKIFVNIYKKHIKELEYLNDFRNNLEHIVEGGIEWKGKKGELLKNPDMLGNLIGDEYDFSGETFSLKEAFLLVDNISEYIKQWNIEYKHFPCINY